MKKFSANCDFGGQQSPFSFNVGVPESEHNPVHFQSDWLSKGRGGNVSPVFVECLMELRDIAQRNNVALDELCVYALGTAISDEDGVQEEGVASVEGEEYVGVEALGAEVGAEAEPMAEVADDLEDFDEDDAMLQDSLFAEDGDGEGVASVGQENVGAEAAGAEVVVEAKPMAGVVDGSDEDGGEESEDVII